MRVEINVKDLAFVEAVRRLNKGFPNAARAILTELAAESAKLAKAGISPYRTGNLRSTIRVDATGDSIKFVAGGIVGSGKPPKLVDYACIFEAHTVVATEKGYKSIGQIKVGDKVLTQTGEYYGVVATSSFLAKEKPNLIEIVCEYRKGRTHKIRVTDDHKMLAFRDGRNKWIPAGKLFLSDFLFTRIKKAHNAGIAKKKTCVVCGCTFTRLDSYANPGEFKHARIVSLKPFKYEKGCKKLYDLSVEGVHSFYANGMLVSNSYVNYGTSMQSPQFFMERSVGAALSVKDSMSRKILDSWLAELR